MSITLKTIILFLFSSLILSASISIDKSLFIHSDDYDKYFKARKGIVKKKQYQLNNHKSDIFGHKIKLSIGKTYHRNSFTRESYTLLNFECIDGPNTGFSTVVSVDSDQGEYIMPGWDDGDFVCVIAQNCTFQACSDSVGPICVYAGSGDQICVDDVYNCGDQLLGDSNNDGLINVLDIVIVVNYILEGVLDFNDCDILASDFNQDQQLNVLDIVEIINLILSGN